MTILFIFLAWLILSSLWGFLPLVEGLRRAATGGLRARRLLAASAGLLGLLTGILFLMWVASYSAVIMMTYDAHMVAGAGSTPSSAISFQAASEVMLRQILPVSACLSGDAVVCALAGRVLQAGSLAGMLPVMAAGSLIPAAAAAFICWKLTVVSRANPGGDML